MTMWGAKAEGLFRLRDEFGADVPPFVAIPLADVVRDLDNIRGRVNEAFADFASGGTDTSLTRVLDDVRASLALDEQALRSFHSSVDRNGWSTVSFRTSAVFEDGPDASFAGQYESYLDVPYTEEALRTHVRRCVESMVSLRVLRYARERGLSRWDLGGSVVVQQMFHGDASGVLFTENGTGAMTIAASSAAVNAVVDGDNATGFVISRATDDGATIPEPIRRLSRLAFELEASVGHPLDIEWALRGNRVVFLQMRPITVPNLDYHLEWDSTNISENYPGVTLPLTYSVIRELYAGVYMSFVRLVGASEEKIRADEPAFRNMLGYLNGHVYYRITNWYALMKFLPGRANQEFFEAMLNPVTHRGRSTTTRRMDLASLVAIVRFLWLLSRSEKRSQRFRTRFAERLAFFSSFHVEYVNAAQLLAASQQIRVEVLADWATPILNDVKLMVFHGVLTRFFFRAADQTEYLAFLQGLTDRASLEPLEHLARVGGVVAGALKDEKVRSIAELRGTPSWTAVSESAAEYIAAFGSRTPGELKLESVRLTDDLSDVLELAVRAHESTFTANAAARADGATSSLNWPAHVPKYQRPLLRWVATHTRRAIDWRERFRFNRAQTFDLTRGLYDAVGRILEAEGLIDTRRDVYWLTEHEIDEIVNAHAWSLDAKALVAHRKTLFAGYAAADASLAVNGAGWIAAHHLSPVRPIDAERGLTGRGVAPGVLTAPVVVCTEFDPALDIRGKILVVNHIDPGWTLLFTQAAGIVAERGNALSHAAIIAREIGIPAVVAVSGALDQLATGDVVTIDGIRGSVTREAT